LVFAQFTSPEVDGIVIINILTRETFSANFFSFSSFSLTLFENFSENNEEKKW
jgi:hypothetical protein